MYIPDLYKNENQHEIEQFLHENGFAILINQTDGKLWGTHTPLFLEADKPILSGHISRENPQAQSLQNGDEILAIFTGPHTYISSSWYDHENVPSWNYIAVHVYGKVRLLDYDETVASLKKLVDKYEKPQQNPIRVEDLSEKTMRQARGILAFEIEITDIQAKKKLSQNRDDKNYKNIINQLEKSNDNSDQQIAIEMRKNR
ncbi:FMN-binding negative transcriptional regulator [Flavobacterium amnicola]|uniref:FMN-binding negative transcriptional regulator n=1 Tax=Flavobacterium amnicola TaxID=2506422 RepID=A0A4Q1K201_9FLAO|nr:FMN-binding negative transcriptional regulator [Flavobacterium amnicola]RXR18315.1 FMN-binding negative transcriptional regulator [Flavobacterium amnicola]